MDSERHNGQTCSLWLFQHCLYIGLVYNSPNTIAVIHVRILCLIVATAFDKSIVNCSFDDIPFSIHIIIINNGGNLKGHVGLQK